MTLISLKSIYKIYNVGGEEVRALDGIDLDRDKRVDSTFLDYNEILNQKLGHIQK